MSDKYDYYQKRHWSFYWSKKIAFGAMLWSVVFGLFSVYMLTVGNTSHPDVHVVAATIHVLAIGFYLIVLYCKNRYERKYSNGK